MRDLRVFTAVKIQVQVLRDVTPCSVAVGYQRFGGPLSYEDVGNMVLRNVGILPQHHTASQPKRPPHENFNLVEKLTRVLFWQSMGYSETNCIGKGKVVPVLN
jgi:hypothetical protein